MGDGISVQPAPMPLTKNNQKNLHQIWRMSYVEFATIKLEIKINGCQRRKLRQPSTFKPFTTDHQRTTKGPQNTIILTREQCQSRS
jgi:hypothetical protein